MQALGNEGFEPTVSLSCHKKEFGEFGGVNASIESSTTFTGTSMCSPRQADGQHIASTVVLHRGMSEGYGQSA